MAGYEVEGVRKAFTALRLLAASPRPLGITEISRSLGVSKATAFRLMHTLAMEGMAKKDPQTKCYRLGPDLAHLGHAATQAFDLRREAIPVMEALTSQLGLPTFLNVPGSREVVCIEHVASLSNLDLYGRAGRTMPYHACPSGYVLLSWAAPELIEQVMSGPLPSLAANTPAKPKQLQDILHQTRIRGFAHGCADLEDGVSSLAAPIHGPQGTVIASLGIAGFSVMIDDRLDDLGRELKAAAGRISWASNTTLSTTA
jgi:DNA-binding IclR family transcriptional regulator